MSDRRGALTALLMLVSAGALVLAASHVAAADKPAYAPAPAWVTPVPIPRIAASTDGSAAQVLLADTQVRLGPDADDTYTEFAVRILTPAGLASVATVSQIWNPDTETLTLHRFAIVRGDRTIDLLAGGKSVTVLRRETDLDRAMLNGQLTAAVQPEGLRVGDVLNVAVTLSRHDPVFAGRSEELLAIRHPGVAGRVYLREIWTDDKPIRWRATEGLPAAVLTETGSSRQLLVDASNVTAPESPLGAPSRFDDVGELETTQFRSWSEVATLMAPLYAKAATLGAASPLHAEIDKIRRASSDPKTRAEAALRLAQDQVHYVFLGMNFGGYTPASTDITWSRRFGDCKGKTALLLALLHELGIEAEPALVSTTLGDGLDQRLPRLGAFDHVIVRAAIGPKVYWLDATRVGDRALDDIPLPDFHWVLPVQPTGSQLEKVEAKPYEIPVIESVERLDASTGLDAPAAAHVEHVYRGDLAVALHLAMEGLGRADAERTLRERWRSEIPWIEPKSVDFTYDDARRVMRFTLEGAAKMDWARNGDVREFTVPDSNLGFNASFAREPGPHADAPFAAAYPSYERWTVQIRLPAKGVGFSLAGATPHVDQVIAGQHYLRDTHIETGMLTMVAESRSETREFPASVAQAEAARLRELSRYSLVVQSASVYAGQTEAPRPIAEEDVEPLPATAAGFSERGIRDLARKNYDRAIEDFTQAATLEPTVAKHVYDRGVAYFEKGDPDRALADFGRAIRLAPGDTFALMARGDICFDRGDRKSAEKDYAEALRIAPDPRAVLERLSAAHERAGLFEETVRDDDTLIVGTPDADRRAALLNARCWARAEWGQELEAALKDCNDALALAPGEPEILDSRGLVHLRLGQYPQSIEDYDGSLRLAPDRPPSLFGRGLARLNSGKTDEGRVDLAAARAADPRIDAQFARYGVRAPPGEYPKATR